MADAEGCGVGLVWSPLLRDGSSHPGATDALALTTRAVLRLALGGWQVCSRLRRAGAGRG
jgi:hypothetical protein